MPLYAIGGMGAGDVKLMAGLGAWIGPWLAAWAFVCTAVAGRLALVMIAYSGAVWRHIAMLHTITHEVLSDPESRAPLRACCKSRKPTMLLLPYAIPIAVGSIAYFAGAGLLHLNGERKGMNGRSSTLAIAVVIGFGAMKLSQQMLSSGRSPGDEDAQEVLVAARDFKEEEILKPEMVKLTRMARSAIPPNAFSTFKEVEERWVRTTMLEGDVLVERNSAPRERRRVWSPTFPPE